MPKLLFLFHFEDIVVDTNKGFCRVTEFWKKKQIFFFNFFQSMTDRFVFDKLCARLLWGETSFVVWWRATRCYRCHKLNNNRNELLRSGQKQCCLLNKLNHMWSKTIHYSVWYYQELKRSKIWFVLILSASIITSYLFETYFKMRLCNIL